MKVLLTGSSGFVGTYFLDNYGSKFNIQKFSFQKDCFDNLHLDGVDAVLHLSALVHRMDGALYSEYERINVSQSIELAKKAKSSGVRQFIFMSSVKVYGEESDIVYSEDSACSYIDGYGKSKLMAENELKTLEDEDFVISIIRTPIVYGMGVKANIKNLINLVQKFPILPFGQISNRRSFVYIGNLCHLLDEVISRRQSGIFLASDDSPISTTLLIELIAKESGRKVYLVKIPFFEYFLKLIKPSFHKRLYGNLEINNDITMHRLNIKNPFSTEEGIKLMIKGEAHD